MSVVVAVEAPQVLLIALAIQFFVKSLDNELEAFVSPYEGGDHLLSAGLYSGFEGFVEVEAKPQNILFEFVIEDNAIKVLIHLPHQLKDLLLCDEEAHGLQALVEFINLNKLVLVDVDLVKHFFEGKALLLEHFEKVIKDVILSHHPVFLLF